MDLFCQEPPKGEISVDQIEVRIINLKKARPFYKQHHYLGGVGNNATNIGVFMKNSSVLVACVSFALPCSENVRASVFGEEHKVHVTELARLAISSDVTLQASAFVPLCLKALEAHRARRGLAPIYGVISYADSSQGHHGGLYQAMSWIYTGESRPSKPFYIDLDGKMIHPRQDGKNISRQQALNKGWEVVDASVKYRYVKLMGSPRAKKKHRQLLKLQALPYPKPTPKPAEPKPKPPHELTLEPSCGCKGDFMKGAIALYGVRANYNLGYKWEETYNEFDLCPTYAQLVAVNSEVEAKFRKNLEGKHGYISIARTLFRQHMGFNYAPEEYSGYHLEPTCIFDLGSCAFFAQKKGTYVYITWAYYDKPLDFEAAERWAITESVYNVLGYGTNYLPYRS